MCRLTNLMAVSLLSALCACATPTAGLPSGPSEALAGIAIAVRFHPPLGPTHDAETVYFVPLDSAGQSIDARLIESNWASDGYVYLLNVPPGQYVAVAGAFKIMGSTYVTYFSKALSESTRTEARTNNITFSGRYLVSSKIGVCTEAADEVQNRFAQFLAPNEPKCGVLRMALHQIGTHPAVVLSGTLFTLGGSTYHYRGDAMPASTDPESERQSFIQSSSGLQARGWNLTQ